MNKEYRELREADVLSKESKEQIESDKEKTVLWLKRFLQSVKETANDREFSGDNIKIEQELDTIISGPLDYQYLEDGGDYYKNIRSYQEFVKFINKFIAFIESSEIEILTNKKGEESISKDVVDLKVTSRSLLSNNNSYGNFIELGIQIHEEDPYSVDITKFYGPDIEINNKQQEFVRPNENDQRDKVGFIKRMRPLTVEDVCKWPGKVIESFSWNAVEVENNLMNDYTVLVKDAIDLSNAIVELKKYVGDGGFVREVRAHIPHKSRRFLADMKDESCEDAVQLLEERAIQLDKKRWELHRKIEAFSLVFLRKNELLVALDIDYLMQGEERFEILGKIQGYFENKKDSLCVQFGIGKGITSSIDGYSPAASVSYQSLIGMGRTREEDVEFINKLILELRERFPLLSASNNMKETGSTHERFAGDTLNICDNSITRQASNLGISKGDMVQRIKEFIVEKLHNSNINVEM